MSHAAGSLPIAVDAMGGDMGPAEIVAAIALALHDIPALKGICLVGDEAILRPMVKDAGLGGDPRVSIFHASEVIGMDDKPIQSLRRKKDASMLRAIELVRDGKAGAAVSTGNTGALMAAGTLRLRPMPGVDRPALASIIPSQKHRFVLLDVGAYPESKAENLVHNAVLGVNYARVALGIERPRVGLLTIGTEEGKGTERIAVAHEWLKQLNGRINYVGPIEGFQLFESTQDVVVCDGFTGNILLKSLESLFGTLKGFLKTELTRNPVRMAGAFLARGAFRTIKNQLAPEKYAGAPLLGLNSLVMKAHGSSNRDYVKAAIGIGWQTLQHDMTEMIHADIETANRVMAQSPRPSNGSAPVASKTVS